MTNYKLFLKQSLLGCAPVLPKSLTHRLRRTCDLLDTGRWLRERSFGRAPVSFPEREQIFDLMAEKIRDKMVLYLEFGVFEGYSIKYWSNLLTDPRAMLHGFDSFEGLPEHWKEDHPKGRFALGGAPPEISDTRVKFIQGWFDQTLPLYVMPPHEQLIINIDCDLYSSTKYVLDHFKTSMPIGTVLYFDEFGSWDHESRAFREFVDDTHMQFELLGESAAMWSAAFRRVG